MMRRSLVCATLVGLQCLGATLARADEPPEALAERQRIAAERAAVEADAAQAEAECRTRFAVSGCVADVQARRRAALAPLRERELALDDAKRKAAAQQSAQRIEAKRAEAASAPPPQPASASVRARAPASAAQAGARQRKPSKTADDAAEAAQRAAEQQQRLSEAAAHRQDVERRNAERAARGKKSQPLPVPSAASVAAIASAPPP